MFPEPGTTVGGLGEGEGTERERPRLQAWTRKGTEENAPSTRKFRGALPLGPEPVGWGGGGEQGKGKLFQAQHTPTGIQTNDWDIGFVWAEEEPETQI